MQRRQFLLRALDLVVIVPAGYAIVACSSGSRSASGPQVNDAGVDSGATTLTFTSSRTLGHTHDFTLSIVAIDSPPTNGISGDTSTNVGHRHQVSITQAQLAEIASGQSVIVETSQQNGHTHSFSFRK